MKRRVEVRTHCRLHFGLTSLGHECDRPQFGGLGVMVQAPGVHLEVTAADRFASTGPLKERVTEFATLVVQRLYLPRLSNVNIRVLSAPSEHVGLGTGTQLGLAIAAGISEALDLSWRDPMRLAQLTGRGRRSAIGTYGFLMGGLIVDAGHWEGETLGRLKCRLALPREWRFVLITPRNRIGCSGLNEDRSIAGLPRVPESVTAELKDLIDTFMIPALKDTDFASFSNGLYRYGCLAGKCFAPSQGGTFSSTETAELIVWLRENGIVGVGQSSWGPTVFALCENQGLADNLTASLNDHPIYGQYSIQCAEPANVGAAVQTRCGEPF